MQVLFFHSALPSFALEQLLSPLRKARPQILAHSWRKRCQRGWGSQAVHGSAVSSRLLLPRISVCVRPYPVPRMFLCNTRLPLGHQGKKAGVTENGGEDVELTDPSLSGISTCSASPISLRQQAPVQSLSHRQVRSLT